MKKPSKISFDPSTRKIDLDGSNCLDVIDVCQAMCCRGVFNIDISREEFESGKYKSHPFCLLTGGMCENDRISCSSRKYRLEKKEDGSCIYLDEESMCSIHESSPTACKEFICTGGWKIDFDFEASEQKLKLKREKLEDDMVFIPNPLIKLKKLFYSQERKEITLVKCPINKCGTVTERHFFDDPKLDDDSILFFTGLFDGKKALKDIRLAMEDKYHLDLSKETFDKLIRMLSDRGIIVFRHADWPDNS